MKNIMQTLVTSKGQITIPKAIRQQLAIHKGCKIIATLVGDHIELHISKPASIKPATGFAMLKSNRAAVPADFTPALHHASYKNCESEASFDDKKFAKRAMRIGLNPAVIVPK